MDLLNISIAASCLNKANYFDCSVYHGPIDQEKVKPIDTDQVFASPGWRVVYVPGLIIGPRCTDWGIA